MAKTTHFISVTQGIYGHEIDNFTIDIDDDLDDDDRCRLIDEEMHRRLNEKQDKSRTTYQRSKKT